jgi:hypothetical protein
MPKGAGTPRLATTPGGAGALRVELLQITPRARKSAICAAV